jgi:hypothetical protein
MDGEQEFSIGVEAHCTDGVCGKVVRLAVAPFDGSVTHLVIEPRRRQGLGRLVPLSHVEETTASGVSLSCTTAELEAFAQAEATEFLPGTGGRIPYPVGTPLSQPYFGLQGAIGDTPEPITYDTPPKGGRSSSSRERM